MRNTQRATAIVFFLGVILAVDAATAAEPSSGPLVAPAHSRPSWAPNHPVLCADRAPLCVHAPSASLSALLRPTLADLELQAARFTDVMGWPAPLRDGRLGGTSGFDVYVGGGAGGAGSAGLVVTEDLRLEDDFYDRTSAFAELDWPLGPGCVRGALLAEAYARASLFGIDAGANHALAAATSAWLASVVQPCEPTHSAAIEDYQVSPQLAISGEAIAGGRGAMLFPWFLQSRLGIADSVDLVHALWALSSQHNAPGAWRWNNEPDLFDVLVQLPREQAPAWPDLLLEYAVARVFVGDRDDGQHIPASGYLGRAGRVRFDWRIDAASLPRTLAPAAPIEPTGSSYIWLDLRDAADPGGLGMRAIWESPAVFRWALIALAADGSELRRLWPVAQERGTELQVNFEDLRSVSAVLIVGVNIGSLAKPFVFDPDEMPYEPQNYNITLVREH
jgi:hypothetical protein